MAAKLTRLTHKIAIQLHLVAESCTICSSGSGRPVRPSYVTNNKPTLQAGSFSSLVSLLISLRTTMLQDPSSGINGHSDPRLKEPDGSLPSSKSHVHFLLLRSFQRIRPRPESCPCALTKHHAMKAYWGSGGIAPLII
jgi:hypothetical protein